MSDLPCIVLYTKISFVKYKYNKLIQFNVIVCYRKYVLKVCEYFENQRGEKVDRAQVRENFKTLKGDMALCYLQQNFI